MDIRAKFGLEKDYVLITLHRPSNVDEKETFERIISAIEDISGNIQFVFPMHPRTKKMAVKFDLFERLQSIPGMNITEPAGYLDFIALMSKSKLVLTDSGGLQEETTALGIPCITIRENTERPVTITEGTNQLVGTDRDKIVKIGKETLEGNGKSGRIPKFWDGKTAQRIVDVLLENVD